VKSLSKNEVLPAIEDCGAGAGAGAGAAAGAGRVDFPPLALRGVTAGEGAGEDEEPLYCAKKSSC